VGFRKRKTYEANTVASRFELPINSPQTGR